MLSNEYALLKQTVSDRTIEKQIDEIKVTNKQILLAVQEDSDVQR